MHIAITIIYVLNCFFLMLVVLLQAGRGGGLAFAGGGGAAMGGRGTATVLTKATVYSAGAFMVLSMLLAHMSSVRSSVEEGTFEDVETVPAVTTGEAAPADEAAPSEAAPVEAAPAEAPAGGE
ncbi:MAG: preprotein translocase subunit SecG [Myxococcales bacterium]|nr:preprotein translocase subunit SecG [Myxococcales bacterium]MCB9530560.1 preprotein translocase subunit SecG [Myxococcales bacterium]